MNKFRAFNLIWITILLFTVQFAGIRGNSGLQADVPAERPGVEYTITQAKPQPQPSDARTKFSPDLFKKMLQAPDEMQRVMVLMHEQPDVKRLGLEGQNRLARARTILHELQSTADRSQRAVRLLLEQAQFEGRIAAYQPLWIVNAIAVQGPAAFLQELAAHPDVALIQEDQVRYLPDDQEPAEPDPFSMQQPGGLQWNIQHVHADQVWQMLNITGQGVVVANMDSGVDWVHPALQASYRGYNGKPLADHAGNWYCATSEGYVYPGDGLGHGTHTMGIIAGSDGLGMAPGVQWIAVKVFSNEGAAYDSWIHAGFQWLLAPDGDPALAPDIVNNSWGSSMSNNQTFLADVQALRAAGILAVFSAGNDGPRSETIGSPGSFHESLAVGAVDREDLIARFSSRGPSPWGEIKPEVCAPGVDIISALPGGGLGSKSGTSMAAPHVAGLAALMLQANPALTVDQIEQILIQTTIPLGETPPNNDYGWGLIDAYAATIRAGSYGWLSGYVTDAGTGLPIVQATIHAIVHGQSISTTTTSGPTGGYDLGLGAAHYDVTVSAPGYGPVTHYGIVITASLSTTLHVSLTPLPTGTLQGHVRQAGSGAPLQALVYVPGTPFSTLSAAGDGAYSLVLPIGTHTVRVESTGHRFVTRTVTIDEGVVTAHDWVLDPAPTILLVDSGAWYSQSQRGYYEQALEGLGYLYDLHLIRNVDMAPTDVPTQTTLLPYDLVIWSAPFDAPGYIGASNAITRYLSAGGRLLLSGQDIGFWDGGGSGQTWSDYLRTYLHARFVADDAMQQTLQATGGPFAGLAITITGTGGADNQNYPDVIAASSADFAAQTWAWPDGSSGGQTVGPCLPYRAILMSFGFEGINDPAARQAVMARAIEWLAAPPQATGLEVRLGEMPRIATGGTALAHALRVRNLSEVAADTYTLNLAPGAWPMTAPAPNPLTLGACQSRTLTLTVQIPADIGWHVYDTATLHVQSALSPALSADAALVSKTPAPVLLVDGTRFYQLDARYRSALTAMGLAYDYWQIKHKSFPAPPSLETLSMYPMLVWYTGYDWYEPLTPLEETRLIAYLEKGGRLFFSSQDYMYYRYDSPFAHQYLGVLEHREDVGTSEVEGQPLHPIGWQLGPYTLTYTYTNWSDGLLPAAGAEIVLRGEHGYPAMLAYPGPNWKTAFAAFSFETLDDQAAGLTMERFAGWLGWLGRSTWSADRRVVAGGSIVTMTGMLYNDGWSDIHNASLTTTLPAEVTLVGGSLSPGAAYDPGARLITWQGSLARGETAIVSFQVQVTGGLPAGSELDIPARIGYQEHGLYARRPYVLRIDAPDLSGSAFTTAPASGVPGRTVRYVLDVRNSGLVEAQTEITATLPDSAVFTGVLDSGHIGSGTAVSRTLSWSGPIPAGGSVSLSYQVALDDTDAYWLFHQVWIQDQYGERWPIVTQARIAYWRTFFPLMFR